MADRVGIVIPAYDADPEQLATYIDSLEETLAPARIHVEFDCPTEDTVRHVAETSATLRVSDRRRGKGAAVTAGFDCLETSILAFVDADGSTPATALAAVLSPVLDGSAHLAVGSRRHPDAVVTVHQSRVRRRLGDVFVRVARQLLPVPLYDYQCGAKAIRRETWEAVRSEITSPGFAWDVELICLAAAVGAEIQEVPIHWEDRPGSTVPPVRSSLEFARALFRGWHRARLLRGSRINRSLDRVVPTATPVIERPCLHGREVSR